MTIARRLKEERSKLGLLEDAFGQLCGHDANTVIGWESGKTEPCGSALGMLVGKCDVIYILSGEIGPVDPLEFNAVISVRKELDAQKDLLKKQNLEFLTSKRRAD